MFAFSILVKLSGLLSFPQAPLGAILRGFLKESVIMKGWLHLPVSSQSSDTTGSYIVPGCLLLEVSH